MGNNVLHMRYGKTYEVKHAQKLQILTQKNIWEFLVCFLINFEVL